MLCHRWAVRYGGLTRAPLTGRWPFSSALSAVELHAVQAFRRRAVLDLTRALEASSGTGVPVQLSEKLRNIASEEVTTALGETGSKIGHLNNQHGSCAWWQDFGSTFLLGTSWALRRSAAVMRPPVTALVGLVAALLPCLEALPKANSGLTRLEQEELAFMKSSLKREMDDASDPVHDSLHGQEKAIRKAYRNIARRFKRNIFDDQVKFEFQMRILNLAKEALMKGDGLGAEGWADEDDEEEDENATKGPGRELPGGSRSSDDILKQIHGWQEFALEEGIRFDDPDKAFFIGHTQHGYRDAFAGNWSQFLREELSDLWPAASGLRYQVELDGSASSEARAHSLRLAEQARQLARESLAEVAGFLHRCGGRDPPLAGPVPESGNTAAWVDVSRNLRALFAGHSTSLIESCAMGADRETRAALLELNLESLERLSSGDGLGRVDVQQELRNAHSAAMAARAMAMPLHCQESANLKRTALERLWEEYHFGPLVEEAYPCDACGLQGLSMFLEFHIGRNGEFPGIRLEHFSLILKDLGALGELLVRRAEPDRTVLRGLRGLLNLQHVLARPAYMSSGASSSDDEATQHSSFASWREAVSDVEEAVWKGIAFPELHTAAGQLMAELAKKGFQPEIIGAMMEHPPVAGGAAGSTLPQGREPSDVQPPRDPRFQGMSIPGYNMKLVAPVQRYEERALRMWGDEEIEEHWDPVRLGLSYIDLTSACDLPLQVAMCFLSAALWMWRALELLGDNCGGDAWLDMYIFEDIWAAPPASKRLAMQYSLKRAIFELVDYAGNMAQHQLLPGARLAVQRISYLLLRKVTDRFGTQEDGQKVKTQLKRFFTAARVNPLWSPPLLPVADAVFIDILSGRLHSAFLEKLHESETKHVLPYAVPEYTLYEAALLGGSDVNVTFARYDVMGALLQDTHRSWADVEAVLQAGHIFPQDAFGFVFGRRADPLPLMADFAAVRGLRIDLATGEASLLLARPSAMAPPLFSLEGAGMPEYPHHPFQRASVSPTDGGLRVEETLLQAALAVQQLASGTEVSFRPPFPTRPCEDGLCRSLPKAIREKLQPIRSLRTEAWDVPSRLVLECPRIPYWQEPSGNVMDIRFGDPRLEVHAGQPLRELNEEEFKKWPVGRLQAALNQVEKELGSNRQADLPALEKQELVDRLLRAAERGLLIEDDEETGEPLVRFSRRLTHHLQDIGAEWPHLARMVPFCALRAAGLILRMQLQQMNQSASEQQEGLKQASEQHAKGMQQQQEEGWRGVLAEVHAGVLRQQGFIDLDPMKCFEDGESGRSFGRCCSVGDYAEECWNGRGAERERCCRGEARQKVDQHLLTSVAAQLGSVSSRRPPPELLIPAVEAWLRNPGAGGIGGTNSMALISLLVEEVNPEELMKQQGHHVDAPVQKLFADLDALSPTPGVKGLVSSGQAGSETWLPVPPLLASGGRRVLYGTVALSPQLVHLEPDEAQAAAEHLRKHYPGTWINVPLENLSHQVLQKDAAKRAALQAQQSPNLRAIYEATQLINLLDERTEDLEAGKVPTESRAVAQISECLTGWRELTAQEIQQLKRGSHLQLRRKQSEEPPIEVRTEVKLLTTGEPSSQYLIWEVSAVGTSELQYFDLLQTDLAVSAPCNVSRPREPHRSNASESVASANASDEPEASEGSEDFTVPRSETTEWPGCIEAGLSRSLEGRGLFVNLGALGIERGCFQDDCSHSDHFEAVTPAECAKICKKIAACRQWIFWEGNPSTCWLRQSLSRLRSAGGALSGSSACVPPDEDEGPAEPNLFSLITSKSGTVPPALWHERDLIGTLEEFGHLTLAEIKQKPSSMRQRTALRAAAEASATYRSGDALLSR
eukprot:s24_g48.t1